MRIVFIPGLGEEASIFKRIEGQLPGTKLFLSFWEQLPHQHHSTLNASAFAQQLIANYGIGPNDIVIGHSTGGWVGLHLKNHSGCGLVQIASWSDRKKVIAPIHNRYLIYWAAQSGLYLNRFTLRQAIKRFYANQPSKEIFEDTFVRLIKGNKCNVVNQLRLIFNPTKRAVTTTPDLRIHARRDPIIRYPDEPTYEVPGDHFSLYTHPEYVFPPILQLINQRYGK